MYTHSAFDASSCHGAKFELKSTSRHLHIPILTHAHAHSHALGESHARARALSLPFTKMQYFVDLRKKRARTTINNELLGTTPRVAELSKRVARYGIPKLDERLVAVHARERQIEAAYPVGFAQVDRLAVDMCDSVAGSVPLETVIDLQITAPVFWRAVVCA